MKDRLLELEVRLLLLREGRRNVIETLASIGENTIADVEREISSAQARSGARASRIRQHSRKSTQDLIAEVCRDRPAAQEIMATLMSRYESRLFLARLRDVERFLDNAGLAHGKLKSRADAMPKVISAMSRLREAELEALLARTSEDADSDYAVLAREIMGGHRSKKRKQEP